MNYGQSLAKIVKMLFSGIPLGIHDCKGYLLVVSTAWYRSNWNSLQSIFSGHQVSLELPTFCAVSGDSCTTTSQLEFLTHAVWCLVSVSRQVMATRFALLCKM